MVPPAFDDVKTLRVLRACVRKGLYPARQRRLSIASSFVGAISGPDVAGLTWCKRACFGHGEQLAESTRGIWSNLLAEGRQVDHAAASRHARLQPAEQAFPVANLGVEHPLARGFEPRGIPNRLDRGERSRVWRPEFFRSLPN